jgi:hypothetical protein
MRYFLNIRRGDEVIHDLEGSELPDLDAARAEAIYGAREILAQNVRVGTVITGRKFEVCDEEGAVVLVVPFSDAVELV